MLDHDERCEVITYASMVAEADAQGEDVPDGVRRLIAEAPECGIAKCHDECPVLAASLARGRELAERFGWD